MTNEIYKQLPRDDGRGLMVSTYASRGGGLKIDLFVVVDDV